MRGTLYALVVILLFFSACKVKEFPKESMYTFTNATGRRLTVDLYEARDGYINNTGRVARYFLDPGNDLKLPLKIQKTAWIDWYTEDYAISNWHNKPTQGQLGYTYPSEAATEVAAEGDHLIFEAAHAPFDTSRSVLLSGNEPSTTWEMDIPSNVSQEYAGTHRFVLSKDFTGTYTFTNTAGTKSSSLVYFRVNEYNHSGSQHTPAPFSVNVYADEYCTDNIAGGTFNNGQRAILSRDTLAGYFSAGGGLGYFPLIRR